MLLKSLGANNSDENGKPGFFEALEKMISKLRQECIAKFADKDDITSLRRRIDDLESDVNELFDKSKNHGISLS
jgi:polyhydroxyalkanoate synthesis regulator phasin